MYPYYWFAGTGVGSSFSPWDSLVFGNSTSGGAPHFYTGEMTSSGFFQGGMSYDGAASWGPGGSGGNPTFSIGSTSSGGMSSGGFLPYGGWAGGGAPAFYGGISSGGFVPSQGSWIASDPDDDSGWVSGG